MRLAVPESVIIPFFIPVIPSQKDMSRRADPFPQGYAERLDCAPFSVPNEDHYVIESEFSYVLPVFIVCAFDLLLL